MRSVGCIGSTAGFACTALRLWQVLQRLSTAVCTTMQAQASRSNWSEFPPELLDTIAQRIARDRAAVQPFHRKLCSAGYSSLFPICNKWMQLASACIPPGGTHRVKLRLPGEQRDITLNSVLQGRRLSNWY